MDGSEGSGRERFSTSRPPDARSIGFRHFRDRIAGAAALPPLPPPPTSNLDCQIGSSGVCDASGPPPPPEAGEISLREWLDKPERSVDLFECLHIFRQIVDTVNLAHSQGIVINNVRPSCFVMSAFNRVAFIESASCSSSGSDSCGDGSDGKAGVEQCSSSPSTEDCLPHSGFTPMVGASERSSSAYLTRLSSIEEIEGGELEGCGKGRDGGFPLKQILVIELNWYTSPEEAAGASPSFASDIYRLGVLLFELFCTFSSLDEKLRTMSNLRHRVLPPQLLLKWPKEASCCLEVLQSQFLNEPRDNLEEREAAIKLKEEIEEQELLLEFLLQMRQRKQDTADKLHDAICCLSSDIEEVLEQQSILKKKGILYPETDKDENSALEKTDQLLSYPTRIEDSATSGSRKRSRPGFEMHNEEKSEPHLEKEGFSSKNTRLMKNFKKLEAAYFSTRLRMVRSAGRSASRSFPASSTGRGSIERTELSSVNNLASKGGEGGGKRCGWIDPFLDGLCKYLSFSKLKVRADLKQGDLLNSSSLVCSLSFDRDKKFFATAGVNRKIKIFECDMILDEDRDIHYPVVEMASKSKLSSVCWNGYIKSQIASSDFEGVVQVWDVTRNQVFLEMREHERRVWSVDFSQMDPTRLASGSDDGTVKLWNINQAILFLHLVYVGIETKCTAGVSIGTIRTKANVCSVQFPPDSARSLAIGSADHKIYCYDLRNTRIPWCTLVGHTKTVSYVKFIDSSTLVSASTDNTLKLWDLSMNTSRVLDTPVQTFTGHTNIKNFVGLSISDGYIATGSETNEGAMGMADDAISLDALWAAGQSLKPKGD
ncbi:Protein SPA1-RELATED 3 [Acorus gramineus]|uniref:Protein SPA1-RELATED 3 n=1 Tax=Acorus gramineus TaxID=55184 RepID=A0AAV9AUE8_ACOGR|nr:Protein SPA1-RELATED 3 [Acorus gramineus]